MLVLLLMALLAPAISDLDRLVTAFLAVSLLVDVAVCAGAAVPAGRHLRVGIGFLVLEELAVLSVLRGPFLDAPVAGWVLCLYAGAVALGSVLLLRLPLPEWLFPVRRVWLRRMLAMVCLVLLVACGPWHEALHYGWTLTRPGSVTRWLLVLHAAPALPLLGMAWNALVRGGTALWLRASEAREGLAMG